MRVSRLSLARSLAGALRPLPKLVLPLPQTERGGKAQELLPRQRGGGKKERKRETQRSDKNNKRMKKLQSLRRKKEEEGKEKKVKKEKREDVCVCVGLVNE